MRLSVKLFIFLITLGFLSQACVSKRKKGDTSALGRFYHNTTGKYNAWFNANELLKVSIYNLENKHKDNYSEILPVFAYNAVDNADSEKASLDKAIQKVSNDISMHRVSRWADDCYYILAKSQYLKKDFETAENSYKYLLEEYSPTSIVRNSKKLREKSVKNLKKEKAAKIEEKKEAKEQEKKDKKKLAKEKARAKEKAKKQAKNKKKKGKTSAAQKKSSTASRQPVPAPTPETRKKSTEETRALEPITEVRKTEKTPNVKNVGSKLVPHRPVYWEASIWAAKNLVERAKYYEAIQILKDIENDLNTPESLNEELYATYAHTYLRQNKYDQAIPHLKKAVDFAKKKKNKARYAFILGQLYQLQNRPVSSDEYFSQVIKLKPGYDLRFHANMNLLLNKGLSGGETAEIEKSMLKLLKDPKNKEYEPEIYYSLAQIAKREGRMDACLNYLVSAVSSPSQANTVKANAYLMLADIQFEKQQYGLAKNYFDSTLLMMPKNDPRRAYPSKMVANLKEISEQLDIISLQDSLIRISGLSTKEKRALAIQLKNKNKTKAISPDAPEAPGRETDRILGLGNFSDRFDRNQLDNALAGQAGKNTGKDSKASTFFAYDQRSLNKGRSTFEQTWGQRKLEDNWRRSNKTTFTSDFGDFTPSSDDKAGENLEEDLANILKGIPSTEQEVKDAHLKIQKAMFRLGVLYREKIDQYLKSRETHTGLLEKYPDFDQREDALYYIYLNCVDLREDSCAAYAAGELKKKYPSSRYTRILTDPSYAQSLMIKKDELVESYQHAYKLYETKDFERAHQMLAMIKSNGHPPHSIDPKIQMLYAMCTAKVSGKEAYVNELKNLVAQFPNSPEESKAKEILRFLKGDEDAFVTVTDTKLEEVQFKAEDAKTHYVIVVFFNPAEKQLDKAKISMSDYHNNYHRLDNLKMTSVTLDIEKNTSIILIRQFENKAASMKYVAGAQRNAAEYIPGFQNFEVYSVTQANYRKILELRSLKEYQQFYNQNYTQ